MLHKGQVLVVVLLLLAVVSTVSLAIVSRSVTDVSTSTTQEESSRALQAAEAGVEAALSTAVTNGATLTLSNSNSATYTVNVSAAPTGTSIISDRGLVGGETVTFFLGEHNTAGQLVINGSTEYRSAQDAITLCWGDNSTAGNTNTPAAEVIVYYWDKVAGKYGVVRNIYDPNSPRGNSYGIDSGTANCPAGHTFSFMKNITMMDLITNGGLNLPGSVSLQMMRVRMLYNGDTPHFVGVQAAAGSTFPQQGLIISSTGQAGVSTRKVQILQKYPDPIPQLDNAIFSAGNLSQ